MVFCSTEANALEIVLRNPSRLQSVLSGIPLRIELTVRLRVKDYFMATSFNFLLQPTLLFTDISLCSRNLLSATLSFRSTHRNPSSFYLIERLASCLLGDVSLESFSLLSRGGGTEDRDALALRQKK